MSVRDLLKKIQSSNIWTAV